MLRFRTDRPLPLASSSCRVLPLAAILAGLAVAGDRVHRIESPRQEGATSVRVLTPERIQPDERLKSLYVLPVEALSESRWGDPAEEARRWEIVERHRLIVAIPTFSALPWYADHPEDPGIRQESYFLQDVVPLVDRLYPTERGAEGRLLVGFSKSGWGAWSLLLRHPESFAKAAAWDAPLMQERPDKYGMGQIFGTQANFERYRISRLVRKRADILRVRSRLVLTGYSESFREHHVAMHRLLGDLGVPHEYADGPKRQHHWESGWLPEAVALLLEK